MSRTHANRLTDLDCSLGARYVQSMRADSLILHHIFAESVARRRHGGTHSSHANVDVSMIWRKHLRYRAHIVIRNTLFVVDLFATGNGDHRCCYCRVQIGDVAISNCLDRNQSNGEIKAVHGAANDQ